MTISERVAYLKGLAEGLELDTATKEGKLISVIIDTLDEFAREIVDLEENAIALGDEIDELSDDLSDIEEIVFGDDEDCDCDYDDDPIFFSVKCPKCEHEITIDKDVLELGAIDCPNCSESLEFDLDEDEDEEEDD